VHVCICARVFFCDLGTCASVAPLIMVVCVCVCVCVYVCVCMCVRVCVCMCMWVGIYSAVVLPITCILHIPIHYKACAADPYFLWQAD